MKKIIAILLCLALALGCAASFAETAEAPAKLKLGTLTINGGFTLQCDLPAGYRMTPVLMSSDRIIQYIASDDPMLPVLQLTVAFDETYCDVDRMNDLTQEELEQLESTFTVMDPSIEITYSDTGYGTRLLIAKQTYTLPHYVSILSIYKGYFVEFYMSAPPSAEDKVLTDEDLQMCIDFLTELDFVPVETNDEPVDDSIAEKTFVADLTNYNPDTNTVDITLKRGVIVDADTATSLKVGDTFTFGAESVVVESLSEEDGDIIVNETYYLRNFGGEYHVLLVGDVEYLEPFTSFTATVPDTLELIDSVDPETGEAVAEQVFNAEQIRTMLESDPLGFASDNVYASFDANGDLALLQRFPTPWQ